MNALLGLAMLVFAGFGVYYVVQKVIRRIARPSPPHPVVRRSARAVQQNRQRDAQSHAFQAALLQLASASDFRRAATLAVAAKLVPAEFRRRQFTRFRPSLIAHYGRCAVLDGANEELLLQSLRDLVVALGVAAFEADYMRDAADRQTNGSKPAATPANRLAELKRDHESRGAAIREGLAQNPELQEQLLEAEENRFRQALETAFEAPSAVGANASPL